MAEQELVKAQAAAALYQKDAVQLRDNVKRLEGLLGSRRPTCEAEVQVRASGRL